MENIKKVEPNFVTPKRLEKKLIQREIPEVVYTFGKMNVETLTIDIVAIDVVAYGYKPQELKARERELDAVKIAETETARKYTTTVTQFLAIAERGDIDE